ncbi:MAG: PKD domain-containing protein [Akkermansiaceae bacterium]|nr:PKD domain-containing protein [Akkermansiaceae bacterium]
MNKKFLSVVVFLIAVAATCFLIHNHPSAGPEELHDASVGIPHEICDCGQPHSKTAVVANEVKGDLLGLGEALESIKGFKAWLDTTRGQNERDAYTGDTIRQGVELAMQRKSAMLSLMQNAPEQALAQALSWADYKSLPKEVQLHVETPFSGRGDFLVLPICGSLDGEGQAPGADSYELSINGASFRSSGFGRRESIGTKENTPLQGIYLDRLAVARSEPLQKLSTADVDALQGDFPVANKNKAMSFYSGKKITTEPVVALGGGKLFYFANEAELQETNQKLEKLDELPGPHSGAQVIFLQAAADDDDDQPGLDWQFLESSAAFQADAWTETKKKVFFIRVDFSDNVGESTSQAALEQVLNTAASDTIRDMSYGKTWIEAEVSSMVVRMPSPTTTYSPSNNSLLHDDAKAAFNALGTGIDLSTYDIVGVHFNKIGMMGGTVLYAGLAGGGRQWLQGTISSGVIIHEFGHNYGLGHARFWDTGGTSVVGAGSTVEYGNDFDIMGSGPDPEGHFHPQGKKKIAWLESSDWIDTAVTGSGTQRLYRGDHKDTTGIRGLRVPKDAAINHYYWVGYRRAITSNDYLLGGVVLNWEQNGTSWLVDTTPGSAAGKKDSGILIGQTYSDPTAGIHITPVAQGGTSPNEWVDVTVNLGTFPGNTDPTATLAGPATGDARSPLVFSVTANDGDGDTLAYSWDFGDGAVVNNQNTATHAWALGGTYNVTVTVSDMKGGTVSQSMMVTVNDPLNSWTVGNVGFTASMSEAAYLNGRYILTGNRYAYFSLDGTNWTRTELALNFRAGGIAYGAGKYVITGYDYIGSEWKAAAFHSNDGKIWTRATVPSLAQMNDLAYGNGMFVAVGDDGQNMYSQDGVTWTAGTATGTENLVAVGFANGEFIAVGDTSVYASSDGSSWVDRSSSTGLASWHSFKDVFYADGKFFAGGWYSGMRYSSDQGVSWQEAAIATESDYDIKTIHVEAGVYVAVAVRKSDDATVLLVSADGLSWKEGTPSNFTITNNLTFGNGVYFSTQGSAGATQSSGAFFPANQSPTASISGSASVNAREVVQFTATSNDTDGDDLVHIWDFQDGTELVTGASAYHRFPTGGSYTVKLTVTDGKGGLVTDTLAVTVTDPLNTWTQRTSGTTAKLYDIATGGGKLVAVGGSTGNRGAYRVSTDAQTWTGGLLGGNITLLSVVYDGAQFLTAGYDYDFGSSAWVGVVYTSPDGSTWTRRHFGGEELRDIAYGGGVYMASGDAGTLLRSTDGISWITVSSGVSTNLQGVGYGDGGFVVVGANGSSQGATILTSTDGAAWLDTSSSAGTTQGFFHVAYLNDRFLASGFHTHLRYSTDGGNSFTNTGAGNKRFPAMAYGNGIYFAAGWDLANSSAHVNMLSSDGGTWSALTTSATVDRNAAVFFQNTFITVGNSGEIWQSDPIPAPTGWTVWQADQFPGYPALSGAYDDFDGDGVDNLMEYITGTNPQSKGSYVRPVLSEESGYVTLTVNKAAGVSGYTMLIQSSLDLSYWDTAGLVVVTDDASLLKVRLDTLTTDPALTRKFLRVHASVSP